MRDVEDFHDAVGQRQPDRHDEQPREIDRAVDEYGDELLHLLIRLNFAVPSLSPSLSSANAGFGFLHRECVVGFSPQSGATAGPRAPPSLPVC